MRRASQKLLFMLFGKELLLFEVCLLICCCLSKEDYFGYFPIREVHSPIKFSAELIETSIKLCEK